MTYPQVSFVDTFVDASCLIGRRRAVVIEQTLRYQLNVLKQTGRYDAFRLKWHPTYDEPCLVWPIPNHLFWDSDVAKWIEGACYFLQQHKLPDIDDAVHELVDMIAAAQQPDGYINIHYTVVAPGKRFTNLKDMHELYNLGHLIEAALAHEKLYKNNKLLGPIVSYVGLLCKTFGADDDQIHGYPGHPELELALLRLYAHTRSNDHLALARYFLTERGNPTGAKGSHFFDWEAKRRDGDPAFKPAYYPEVRSYWYHQAHKPIAEQETIEGHSVRAVYLLTAYTDLCRLDDHKKDEDEPKAARRLWNNMVEHNMYVTGGIGAIRQWEGFGPDNFLPQSLDEGGCYSETCAAIGVMMWAQRFLEIELDAAYADVMELCLYNAVLTAMSHDGKAFTYHNQLGTCDDDLDKRCDWFTVACCPPNIMRLLGSIGGYIWSSRDDDADKAANLAVHLFVSSTVQLSGSHKGTSVTQTTEWPWKDNIDFRIDGPAPLAMQIRIPRWATQHTIEPKCPSATVENGYLRLPSDWLASHRQFSLTIPLKARWVAPPSLTGQSVVAMARGPIIYCVEDFDNAWVEDHFKTTFVDPTAELQETFTTDKTSGEEWVSITLRNGCRIPSPESTAFSPYAEYTSQQDELKDSQVISKLTFVPYGLRANRGGKGHMRVGLRTYTPTVRNSWLRAFG